MRVADPTAAASEWDSEFRDDLSGLFDDAVIDRAVNRSRPLELPPQPDVIYNAYVDPSGGASSGDAYSICIGHKDGERSVVDVVRARTGPFNPQEVTREYAALCKQYRVSAVTGDKYAKEWVQQAWRDLFGEVPRARLGRSLYHRRRSDGDFVGCFTAAAGAGAEAITACSWPHRQGIVEYRVSHDDLANAACAACVVSRRNPRRRSPCHRRRCRE